MRPLTVSVIGTIAAPEELVIRETYGTVLIVRSGRRRAGR
jgi:hypothetical protein